MRDLILEVGDHDLADGWRLFVQPSPTADMFFVNAFCPRQHMLVDQVSGVELATGRLELTRWCPLCATEDGKDDRDPPSPGTAMARQAREDGEVSRGRV